MVADLQPTIAGLPPRDPNVLDGVSAADGGQDVVTEAFDAHLHPRDTGVEEGRKDPAVAPIRSGLDREAHTPARGRLVGPLGVGEARRGRPVQALEDPLEDRLLVRRRSGWERASHHDHLDLRCRVTGRFEGARAAPT